MEKPFVIGVKEVKVWVIPVNYVAGDEDWEFVLLDMGDGKKQLAVF